MDIQSMEWSYIWVDWTCMPQSPRDSTQEEYFHEMLTSVHKLIRDCAFEWRFASFKPRAWVLYEIAECVFNHIITPNTDDVKPFLRHLQEMHTAGVQPVLRKYGYHCTNDSDMSRITMWLEIIFILLKVVPSTDNRRYLFEWINGCDGGLYSFPGSDITIDKTRGIITHKGTDYPFTPVL
jgi:hypothetical protein